MEVGKATFVRSIFTGDNGGGSSSRLCVVSIVAFVIGAGAALLYKMHSPVTMKDFIDFLGAAGTFIATSCGPLYLINKSAEVVNNRLGQDDRNTK